MSGHSKWATIKHKKGAADQRRAKLFAKLIRQVEVSAREGGGDPEMNPTLRTMFQKARDSSVPLDTIERAIKRGTGELEGVTYEQITYEGYAPGGVAMLIEVLTDNRNRTGSDVRSLFSKRGGSMAEPGAVAWQFERRGVILVDRKVDEEELMMGALDAGADDVVDDGEAWRVVTPPSELHAVRSAIEAAGMAVESADLTMEAANLVPLDDTGQAKQVLGLIDALEDLDDVQAVHANFDISDDVLESGHHLMGIGIGDVAPDFTLPGVDRGEAGGYTLSAFRGQPVVLVFYPGDNTPVCTMQLTAYTSDIDRFADVGAQVLALSPQSVESHKGFSCRNGGFAFPLLADEDKAVGLAYGIVGPLGFYRRSIFVVGRSGIVSYVHRAIAGLTFKPTEDLIEAVKDGG